MLKNWKVTCNLMSPICGDAPYLDSLLEYELSLRLGMKNARKMTRNVPLSEIEKPPIPLAKKTINGHDIYCSSNPIYGPVASEWVDHTGKRSDTGKLSLMVKPEKRRTLLTASGPYKMRYVPNRIRLVNKICWFVRGDRKEINKLLKKIVAMGHLRNIGYGMIAGWEYEEIENDYSIFAEYSGKKVLMKTIPEGSDLNNVTAFTRSFGGGFPPYWHPETFMEIAVPC
jgi:hypothetical protein